VLKPRLSPSKPSPAHFYVVMRTRNRLRGNRRNFCPLNEPNWANRTHPDTSGHNRTLFFKTAIERVVRARRMKTQKKTDTGDPRAPLLQARHDANGRNATFEFVKEF